MHWQLNDAHGLAVALSNVGCIHAVMDNTQPAIEALEQALELWTRSSDLEVVRRCVRSVSAVVRRVCVGQAA